MANFEDLIMRDTRANQPAAGIEGRLYYVTDEDVMERDSGAAWENVEGENSGGDVVAPANNTDEYMPQWDGEDSKTLKDGLPVGTASGAVPARSGDNILDADEIKEITAAAGVTVEQSLLKDGYAELTQISAPGEPGSGKTRVYTKSDGKVYRHANGGSETELGGGAGGSADYICVRDVKSQNTSGGSFASGDWRTRDINTEVSDAGGHCSISSNQITLAAGTYVCCISAPAYQVRRHQAKLYNVSDAADILVGTSEIAYSGVAITTRSFIQGSFILAASKTLEVRHKCEQTLNNQGFGVEANFASEIYTVAEFWKVG